MPGADYGTAVGPFVGIISICYGSDEFGPAGGRTTQLCRARSLPELFAAAQRAGELNWI